MVSEIPKYQRFRDPFAEDPVPKAFYHPTLQRDLSQAQKQTALSPVRGTSKGDNERTKLTVPDKQFLKGANTLSSETPPKLGQEASPNFDESWPSTEHQSTVSMFGIDERSPPTTDLSQKYSSYVDRFADLKQTLQFSENDGTLLSGKHAARGKQPTTEDGGPPTTSVLGRYIDRFRRGDAMSREERQKMSDPRDFWWLDQGGREKGSPSDSSTPREDSSHVLKAKTHRLTEESLASLSQSHQSRYSGLRKPQLVPASPSEERTRKLQEKADRFLEKSVSSLATTDQDFEVSTEGLGSSVGETTQISLEEQPYRPKFVKDLSKENVPRFNLGVPISMVTKPTCREEDILYQWRIKRKMEQARERTTNVKDVPTPSPFVPKLQPMGDVEKKLEEFKQRLSEGKLGVPVTPQMSNGLVSFTPAPHMSRPADGKEDTGTSRGSQGKTDQGAVKDDPYVSGRYPSIASPTLKRKGKRDEDVEPHLHLMCDLLPCPHQSEFSKQYGKVPVNVDSSENVNESESETYKYLEAERPDIEKSICDQEHDPSDDDSGHTDSGVRGQVTEVKRRINYDQEDDYGGFENVQKKGSKNNVRTPREEIGSKSDSDSVPGFVKVSQQQNKRTPRQENEEELSSSRDNVQHHQRKERRGERKVDREMEEESQREGRKERKEAVRVPVPRQSQSPGPRAGVKKVPHVQSAIGQVIKDRLFDLSTSSVISSVDSLPTFVSPSASLDHTLSESLSQPPQGRISQSRESVPHHTEPRPRRRVSQEEEEESDGEFPDDQLLTMLRRQRAQYEEQLRMIDEKLATTTRNGNEDSGR
ncbi:uncharacterized protein LOC110461276 [Mizuhopecten yessoensis]|uniref:uncharacterized protein LOC110461276 n=1 Tax=Mizuhopecten yessoensis TaxID=6573 RepID=UPI000B4589CE|nr:uncharacterized protein LOC110461276 [Mizuhopecten yessoensis]